ncbi:MAG: 2-amino-4-hydroxy-6-hydroxymethyldihydropteridine diphosphokinase [Spirochaetes bacterium]|nr:2-amino-4-hydroxy-6-hydroxymethyldihydropteridine diphosphokinase [Spirochaetota bacterium]
MEDSCEISVHLGVGSNIGNREKNIAKAFLLLKEHFFSLETASLYESKAMYNENQPDFLNTVFRGRLQVPPAFAWVMACGGDADSNSEAAGDRATPAVMAQQLLALLGEIEKMLGRERDAADPKGPRTIDLDILLFGDYAINTENLVIPHQGICERLFVLLPLLELDKDLRDPISMQKYNIFLPPLEKTQSIYYHTSSKYIEEYGRI